MNETTEDFEFISIYLKHPDLIHERIGETALFPGKQNLSLSTRKWIFFRNLHWFRKITLLLQMFAFRHFGAFSSTERRTKEAKFKTCLALLLVQENLRELFFRGKRRSRAFLKSIQKTAKAFGIKDFKIPLEYKNSNPL